MIGYFVDKNLNEYVRYVLVVIWWCVFITWFEFNTLINNSPLKGVAKSTVTWNEIVYIRNSDSEIIKICFELLPVSSSICSVLDQTKYLNYYVFN